MNKRILLTLCLPLLLSSCGASSATGSSASSKSSTDNLSSEPPRSIVAASDEYGAYKSETINVRYFDSSFDTRTEVRYYEESDVAYISFRDYIALMYRGRDIPQGRDSIDIKKEENVYTITLSGGFQGIFDLSAQTFESADFAHFKMNNILGAKDENLADFDGLPFVTVKEFVTKGEMKKKTIAFSDYDMKIYGDATTVYLPLTFLGNLFSGTNILVGAYNRKDLYFYDYLRGEDPTTLPASFYEGFFQKSFSKEYASYFFNEICLSFDHFQGRPGRSSLERYYPLENGLKAALETRPLGRKLIELLKSDSLSNIYAGIQILYYLGADGGHTTYNYGMNLSLMAFPSWMPENIIASVNAVLNEVSAGDYEEMTNATTGYRHHGEVYAARQAKLGKEPSDLKGEAMYTKVDDVAFIHVDGFMNEIDARSEWEDYYEGKTDSIPYGEKKGGAVAGFFKALEKARNDPGVKQIILDLAANSGGSTDEMMFMISLLTGGDKPFVSKDTQSSLIHETHYKMDRNLDRKFDAEDEAFDALGGKPYAVLTSQNGFSCGGISPIYLHDYGAFVMGDNCGGGSCSILYQHDAFGHIRVVSSPSHTIAKNGNSIDVERKNVCDAKITLPTDERGALDFSSFYDVQTLKGLIANHQSRS